MLKVCFQELDHNSIIIVPMLLFNSVYENEWFQDERVLSILRNIDKVEYIGENLFKSELLGYITAEELSTGSKTLILMLKYDTDMYYRMSNLGDNCYRELAKIQNDINVKIWVDCLPKMRGLDLTFISEEEKQNILDKINSKYKFLREENGKLIYDNIIVKVGKDCIVIRKALHDIDEVADYYVTNHISASFNNNMNEIYEALAKRLGVDPKSEYVNNEDFMLDYDAYEHEVTLFFKDKDSYYDFDNRIGVDII